MRKLMWFSIGFILACGVCAYGLDLSWIPPLAAVSVFLFVLAGIAAGKWRFVRRVAAVYIGCAAGLCWYLLFYNAYLLPAVKLDSREAYAEFTATDYSYETYYGFAVDGTTVLNGKTYRVKIYGDDSIALRPGDRVRGTFRFRVTTPDGKEESTYHKGNGIFLLAYQQGDVSYARAAALTWREYPAVLRQKIRSVLQNYFPEDVFPFTKALLLGDTNDLDYETDTALKISGIRHVVAVSGLHVSMLYSIVLLLSIKRRYLTAIIGIPILTVFAAVIGFTPSVVRSCIMVGLMMIAGLLDREHDSPTELSVACLVMLAVNPLSVTSVSLQLSAGCVAGILLFGGRLQAWLSAQFPENRGMMRKLQKWFCSSVSMTLGAMSLTMPLSAWYFGSISLVSVLTNLVTLWLITFIFTGLILVCGLHLVCAEGAAFLAGILAWPIRYVLFVAKWISSFPLASIYTCSVYVAAWLVFFYMLLAVFLMMKKRQPMVFLCLAAIGLCFSLILTWLEPRLDDARITVFDVGQGQSILLQSKGASVLVDCGGEDETGTADQVAQRLFSQGITRLDAIILTHNDFDHVGAVQYLLTRVQTDCIIMTRDDRSGEIAAATNGNVIYPHEDLVLHYGGAELTVFAPDFLGEPDQNGLCVLFDTEKCDILITGDRDAEAEAMLLPRIGVPNVDILVAGHHGSRYATSDALLKRLGPETVIISVGEGNRYGHPSPELLTRLDQHNCQVFRTDQHGTILIRR